MTSVLTLARVAALIAIFGFFLPWAEVSCSGQPLAHETGLELITGGGPAGAGPAHHDLWVAASLALIVLGLAGGLFAGGRRAAAILTAAALAALAASVIGVSQEVPNAEAQAQLAEGPPGGDPSARQAAGDLVRARLEYGYFVTLGGLIAAAAGGALTLTGPRSLRRELE